MNWDVKFICCLLDPWDDYSNHFQLFKLKGKLVNNFHNLWWVFVKEFTSCFVYYLAAQILVKDCGVSKWNTKTYQGLNLEENKKIWFNSKNVVIDHYILGGPMDTLFWASIWRIIRGYCLEEFVSLYWCLNITNIWMN